MASFAVFSRARFYARSSSGARVDTSGEPPAWFEEADAFEPQRLNKRADRARASAPSAAGLPEPTHTHTRRAGHDSKAHARNVERIEKATAKRIADNLAMFYPSAPALTARQEQILEERRERADEALANRGAKECRKEAARLVSFQARVDQGKAEARAARRAAREGDARVHAGEAR